jgi:hypothetical protein
LAVFPKVFGATHITGWIAFLSSGERMMSDGGINMVGITETRLRRDIPDALVMTSDLGAVGFCYNPETHMGKHPRDTFIVKLTPEQMDEIRGKARKASEERRAGED